jgi:hypothetical protein
LQNSNDNSESTIRSTTSECAVSWARMAVLGCLLYYAWRVAYSSQPGKIFTYDVNTTYSSGALRIVRNIVSTRSRLLAHFFPAPE